MARLQSYFVLFALIFSFIFQVSDVSAQDRLIKHHPVLAINPPGVKAGFFGGGNVHRFADIDVEADYKIFDTSTSKAKVVVYSGVLLLLMGALRLPFLLSCKCFPNTSSLHDGNIQKPFCI